MDGARLHGDSFFESNELMTGNMSGWSRKTERGDFSSYFFILSSSLPSSSSSSLCLSIDKRSEDLSCSVLGLQSPLITAVDGIPLSRCSWWNFVKLIRLNFNAEELLDEEKLAQTLLSCADQMMLLCCLVFSWFLVTNKPLPPCLSLRPPCLLCSYEARHFLQVAPYTV